jgi:class 3 adenylate cyclase/tetratricopeptide (TPR) repeat protein
MHAYSAQGQRHLVVLTYERCRSALEELGLKISPALDEVHAAATFEPAARGAPSAPAMKAPVPGPARLREERKVVSVFFAGVTGPGLASDMDPEDLRNVIGGVLTAVIAEVERLGGTVTSISGGGLAAIFGAPEAHEDDPERAVRAGFRALLAVASPSGTGSSAVRIGIETGPAVVGPIGGGAKVEYGAVGEVTGVAAALQSVARVGSVLVGPATRGATEALFDWGPTEEVVLTTGTRSVVASYLEGPKAHGAGSRGQRGGRSRLVGRAAELAILDGALREAVRGRGSVVVLVGEAGLGKTRLVQECRKRFMAWVGAGTGRLPLWLEGRSASYASSTPYGLYQQLLAAWVGVAPDQDEAVVRPALERALVAVMGDKDLWPILARMMGLPGGAGLVRLSPEELQRATFSAMGSVVSRLVAIGPTVLVLEDLHWADRTSLRLSAELAALARDGPLLVIATRRPDPSPEASSFERSLVTGPVPLRLVELAPLSEVAEQELAVSLVGTVASEDVLDAVRAGVGGNPLFLEERLYSLIDIRALVREQGMWHLTGTVETKVPEVLERLVRSRVDRLSPAGQQVVRTASVLGPELSLGLLTAVCETERAATEETLGPAIAELSSAGLLQEVTGLPEPTYRFRHALIQEATYSGMLRPERRRLHGRAAWTLEAMSAGRLEQVASVLGRHFAAAGEAERAVHYFEMAGEHAARAFANEEAISSFRSALEIADDANNEVMARAAAGVWAKLAEVLWATWRLGEAREAFQAALHLVGPDDALQGAHLYALLGKLEGCDYRHRAALAAFDAAEELLGERPWEKGDAWADVWLEVMLDGRAEFHLDRNEPELGLAALAAARPVVEARGSPAHKWYFYWGLAYQRAMRNRWRVDEEDIANMRRALAAAKKGDSQKDIAYATYNVGEFLLMHGDLAEARGYLERSLALSEHIGQVLGRANSLWALTLTALHNQDAEAVRSLAPQAMAAGETAAYPELVGTAKASLAWLAWQDGRPRDLVALANEALELWRTTTAWPAHALYWVGLWPIIAACLSTGHVPEAVAAGRQMLEPSQLRLPDELESLLGSAATAWDQDEPELAKDKMAAALELARDLHWF